MDKRWITQNPDLSTFHPQSTKGIHINNTHDFYHLSVWIHARNRDSPQKLRSPTIMIIFLYKYIITTSIGTENRFSLPNHENI